MDLNHMFFLFREGPTDIGIAGSNGKGGKMYDF